MKRTLTALLVACCECCFFFSKVCYLENCRIPKKQLYQSNAAQGLGKVGERMQLLKKAPVNMQYEFVF